LYAECKKDPSFYEKVNMFLEAGKTMTPDDIFKNIGIDTLSPDFFEKGIKSIEEDIDLLEKLMRKHKMM
jgi:oligoendopeptidase F